MQGCFPEPDKDPVIQIASMVTNQGEKSPVVRNVMTLDTCAAIIGSEVMSFKTEEELLRVFAHCSMGLIPLFHLDAVAPLFNMSSCIDVVMSYCSVRQHKHWLGHHHLIMPRHHS